VECELTLAPLLCTAHKNIVSKILAFIFTSINLALENNFLAPQLTYNLKVSDISSSSCTKIED
jgi:hypothetical protein